MNYKKFTINKATWYHGAEIIVIPTKVFGKTKIELYLKEHVLLGTGHEIGIYNRDKFTPFVFSKTFFLPIQIRLAWAARSLLS